MPEILDLIDSPDQAVIITAGTKDRDRFFERVCKMFPEARIEMDAAGNVIMFPYSSDDSSFRSGEAAHQLAAWARRDGTGRAFDCSKVVNVPNGAKRSPDAAWVSKDALHGEGDNTRRATKTRYVPPFVIEVTSPSDTLKKQQEKCEEWIANGVSEAFLLHPKTRTAYVYRPGKDIIEIPNAGKVKSSVLKGFMLDCTLVWEELA